MAAEELVAQFEELNTALAFDAPQLLPVARKFESVMVDHRRRIERLEAELRSRD